MSTSHVLNFLKYEIAKNSIRFQNFPTQREAYCFHLNWEKKFHQCLNLAFGEKANSVKNKQEKEKLN